jgi:hypothetical protein
MPEDVIADVITAITLSAPLLVIVAIVLLPGGFIQGGDRSDGDGR